MGLYNRTNFAVGAAANTAPFNTEYTKIANAINSLDDANIGTPLTGTVLNLTAPGAIGAITPSTGNFTTLTATTATITNITGNGALITALNATQLTSGTIPDARFPATLPAISGALLTNLNADNLASGTVPDARFPATLPAVSGVNLTALNATQLTSGTIPDARFPAILPAIDGSALTNLNATQLTSGTVPQARLNLTSLIVNADINVAAAIVPSKLVLQGIAQNVQLGDTRRLYLGDANDLELYHDGTNSFIYNNTGSFTIGNLAINQDVYILVNDGGVTRTAIQIDSSDSARILTRSMRPQTDSAFNCGHLSYRYLNVYGDVGNFAGTIIDANEVDFASATFTLQNQGNTRVSYSNSVTIQYNQFRPAANKGFNLGDNSYAWDNAYADDYINKCMWLDTEDDLALLEAIQPLKDKKGKLVLEKGKPKVDYSTLPDFVRPDWKYQFRTAKENKDKFGKEPIPTNSDGYSIGNMLDLAVGAIRQLNKKVDDLETQLKK